MQLVFWSSVCFILYAYVGYPLALFLLSLVRSRPVEKRPITPPVSFVIAAYNEEARIREKIENTLAQNYPADKLEILVASDHSTDKTDAIVQSFSSRGVRLLRLPHRMGKETAQKHAVEEASGEILVFSDAATTLPPDGITKIVQNFADPSVGCVSSVDRFIDADGKISGEGAYVRYEMFLRNLETKVNSLVGLSGSFFAVRREICHRWAPDLQSDFNTLLNAVRMGLRGVSDPDSIGYYKNIVDEKREFERKVRTVLRGISVFMTSLPLLNPFQYSLFSWQLMSHKLCRWLVPFAMISSLISNAALTSQSSFYLVAFLLQVGFYAIALGGLWARLFVDTNLLKLPSFLVLANLSILNAWMRYLRGERLVAWEPSKR